ncbi:hypothetical protein [Halomontanus rarus]|uniref:hypothetical protein n=1 Tax=Halomontanus rarus TaxID=3034020 RepID=UPI0023E7BFE9|nr:hypothetical protein [Halovivax sp. TS33]
MVVLELKTDTGAVGVGFDTVETDLETIAAALEASVLGASPFAVRNRIDRPRGGNQREAYERLVDVALWDLCGKHLDIPLYKLMGGMDRRVPVHASGLAFHHDDETAAKLCEEFRERRFDTAKVEVGYPTVEEDLDPVMKRHDFDVGTVLPIRIYVSLGGDELASPCRGK